MDYKDMDEETREKRKREQVEYRTKKHNSVRFMIFSSVFEIIETVLIMFILFVICAFIVFKLFKATGPAGQSVFQVLLIVIFLGGMVSGFFVYKKCARWYIKKFKMFDKLNDDVLIHYFKEEELGLEDDRLK